MLCVIGNILASNHIHILYLVGDRMYGFYILRDIMIHTLLDAFIRSGVAVVTGFITLECTPAL